MFITIILHPTLNKDLFYIKQLVVTLTTLLINRLYQRNFTTYSIDSFPQIIYYHEIGGKNTNFVKLGLIIAVLRTT